MATRDEFILQVEGLRKRYPNGVEALKGLNFNVKKGEFLVVIGLSGSGKSTLLRCLNRLEDPTDGKILFQDQDQAKASGKQARHLRQHIAMIFQHFNLIPRYTVLSNALAGRLAYTSTLKSCLGFFSKQDLSKAKECLRLVGLSERMNVRADQLSGGQQQRVAIARALMQSPEILLADEPVASLDPATCHLILDHLKHINQTLGITVICNLHFLSLVRKYADRVIALKGGEIVYQGSPSQIDEAWFAKIYGEGAKEVHVN